MGRSRVKKVSRKRKKSEQESAPYRSLHFSDIHLWNRLPYARVGANGVTDRLQDQERLIYRIFDTAREQKCKAIFAQGDIFDQSRVDAVTLTVATRAFARTPVPLFFIPGNHDGVNTRGERFTVEALDAIPNCQCMETGSPYSPRPWLHFWPLEYAPLERTREMLAGFKLKRVGVNNLLMHNSVVGCTHVGWECEEGHGLDAEEVTGRFDHVLSGHFHDPQMFGGNGRYLGAPLHLRADDAGRDAGYWVIDWYEDGRREETFFDGGCPRFYALDWDEVDIDEDVDDMNVGDYVRVKVTCTHADLIAKKPAVVQYIEALTEAGLRASWHHDPVYQHTTRIADEDDATKVVPVRGMVSAYVDAIEVDTRGLVEKELRRVGHEIFAAVEGEWQDVSETEGSIGRLLSIEGEDFAGFRHFKMKLRKQGLTFVDGDNRDTEAASSNGACKTGLFKALGWGLYGEAIDERVGDELIHMGQTCARVKVRIAEGGDKYTVIRERRKQSPKLFIEKNDERLDGVSKTQAQRMINALMGTDWPGFRNTAMYGQGDRDRFVYPTTKDTTRKRILHRILRTGIFELCFGEAKVRRLAAEKERDWASGEVERLTERLTDHDLSGLQERADGYEEERREKIRELTEEARTLAARARNAVGKSDKAALTARLEALDTSIASERKETASARLAAKQGRQARDAATSDLARLRAELAGVASTLDLLGGDQCPTCTASLAKGRGAAHRKAQETRKAELGVAIAEAEQAREKAATAERKGESDEESAEVRRQELADQRAGVAAQLKSAESEKQRARELAADARAKGDEARVLKEAENPYLADLEAARTKVRKLKRERKSAREKLADTTGRLSVLEFWVRGFGPKGIPSFALDSVMPFLTERANWYLDVLSDGDMNVSFSTQRELKRSKGEMRDEIAITWHIEGIEDYPPSGGQWKKMEIATNFALMDLVAAREGAHVNLLCLDECLDGVDEEGRQRVVDLLHKLRSERESIFVISHDTGLSEVFERTLTVIKEDGVSRLERSA